MQPILKSCCGIDVHKSMIKACIAKGPLDKPPKLTTRTFSTLTSDLLKLKDWLRENEVEAVAMESTVSTGNRYSTSLRMSFQSFSRTPSTSRRFQETRVMLKIANG